MEFKDKVLYCRARLNLTQLDLANRLKVSVITINRWENGVVVPTKKAELAFDIFCAENDISFSQDKLEKM